MKELCKRCAMAMEAEGKTLVSAGGKAKKITCAVCGLRRCGLPYTVGPTGTGRKRKEK